MTKTTFSSLCGPLGPGIQKATQAARLFLSDHASGDLLQRVGHLVPSVPTVSHLDKTVMQDSWGGATQGDPEDLLAARGLFYITEQRKLFLDCTAGHYQMTWGYDHPVLVDALLGAIKNGIVWDNHSNIPQWPVKRLAQKLVILANPDREELKAGDFSRIVRSRTRLNTVLLGVCTGSVAAGAALKMLLLHYRRSKPKSGVPVLVSLEGNYHGTDMLAQRMRGMWPELFHHLHFVSVEPNDREELEETFSQYGERIAGFWAEPVMMNREAIELSRDYLKLVRRLCDLHGALLAVDEIQTGFWFPGAFLFKEYDIRPDVVVVGKGLTAGFHPLSGLIYRSALDCLEQYDAISTNGHASLAAYMGLANLALLEDSEEHLKVLSRHWTEAMFLLAEDFHDILMSVNGHGLLTGLKFRRVEEALDFHKKCVAKGLWVRVHAYHEGHSTILVKFALCVDSPTIDFFVSRLRQLLSEIRTG